eukprot:IDg14444t1
MMLSKVNHDEVSELVDSVIGNCKAAILNSEDDNLIEVLIPQYIDVYSSNDNKLVVCNIDAICELFKAMKGNGRHIFFSLGTLSELDESDLASLIISLPAALDSVFAGTKKTVTMRLNIAEESCKEQHIKMSDVIMIFYNAYKKNISRFIDNQNEQETGSVTAQNEQEILSNAPIDGFSSAVNEQENTSASSYSSEVSDESHSAADKCETPQHNELFRREIFRVADYLAEHKSIDIFAKEEAIGVIKNACENENMPLDTLSIEEAYDVVKKSSPDDKEVGQEDQR